MTDIMKLAQEYAVRYRVNRAVDEARAALQSAIEALQSECAEHKENAIRNARIAVSIRAERDQLQSKLGDAIQSSAHWQHQCTEAQAENERLKSEREALRDSAKEVARLRDQLQSQLDAMGKGEPVAPEQVEAAWRAGWASFRDAEYVGQEAEDEAWGMSQTCANADWESAAPKALAPEPLTASEKVNGLHWAVSRWHDEVSKRPLGNKSRRPLDGAWRQVISYFGGNPDQLCGRSHDKLVAAHRIGGTP